MTAETLSFYRHRAFKNCSGNWRVDKLLQRWRRMCKRQAFISLHGDKFWKTRSCK